MTSEQARQFNSYSVKNAAILAAICPECEPYKDWFTYKRWLAQGKQVAKGETGSRISVIVESSKENEEGELEEKRFTRTVPVFCRHQVK